MDKVNLAEKLALRNALMWCGMNKTLVIQGELWREWRR